MLLYKKYIIGTIIPPFFTITAVFTFLVWIIQTLKFIYLLDNGVRLKHFFGLAVLLIPFLLFMILPIILVITIIFVYNRMMEERQITAFRNSGISNYQIAKPALFVAFVVTIFSFYLSAYLMPVSYSSLKEQLGYFKNNYVSNIIEPKIFNQISKHTTIYVNKKTPDHLLKGIILFENKATTSRSIIFAKEGRVVISKDQIAEFHLSEGVRHSYDKNNNITKLSFDNLIVSLVNENIESGSKNKNSAELFLHEMFWPDSDISSDRKNRLVTDAHLRIIWPVFNFVFVFLALSVFLHQSYNRKSQVKQFIWAFLPVIIAAYIHFTAQKVAYHNLQYIYLCYINIFLCIFFGVWQNMKKKI